MFHCAVSFNPKEKLPVTEDMTLRRIKLHWWVNANQVYSALKLPLEIITVSANPEQNLALKVLLQVSPSTCSHWTVSGQSKAPQYLLKWARWSMFMSNTGKDRKSTVLQRIWEAGDSSGSQIPNCFEWGETVGDVAVNISCL